MTPIASVLAIFKDHITAYGLGQGETFLAIPLALPLGAVVVGQCYLNDTVGQDDSISFACLLTFFSIERPLREDQVASFSLEIDYCRPTRLDLCLFRGEGFHGDKLQDISLRFS